MAISLFTTSVFAATDVNSSYKIVYKTNNTQWKLANQQQDPEGYSYQYQPNPTSEGFRTITINYGKNVQLSLKDSMQQVVGEMNTTDCQRKESNVLKQDQHTLVFKTVLAECPNGKSLEQVFKVFSMPDGQYSIVYSTDSISPSNPDSQKMQAMIESAELQPVHHS